MHSSAWEGTHMTSGLSWGDSGDARRESRECVWRVWEKQLTHLYLWKGKENSAPNTQTHTHRHTVVSKYTSTWTSIQLPCLCNVSFTQPGPLTNSRPDPVFISGWKDGVKEHPPSARSQTFNGQVHWEYRVYFRPWRYLVRFTAAMS